MIFSSVEHQPLCLAPDGSKVQWDPETGDTTCLSCGAVLEDHEGGEETGVFQLADDD